MLLVATFILALCGPSLSAAAAAAPVPTGRSTQSTMHCGYWRWPVKTGADTDRLKVHTRVIDTTISYLDTRRMPSAYPQDQRIWPVEYHTFQVNRVWLTGFREEADRDIHLVLQDGAGRSMIAEIPDPACVSKVSPWRSAIAATRGYFSEHYTVTTSWRYVHRPVDVRGLGFFDEIHGQVGVAPNGIELHPVIWMTFLFVARSQSPSCMATAAWADDGYPGDYYISITSNQPYTEATASDATDRWSKDTNGSGSAMILLYYTYSGESISVTVGSARCSTSA